MLKLQILLKSSSPFNIISTLSSILISLFVCLFWCLLCLALDTSLFRKVTLVHLGHHIKTQDEHPLPQLLGPIYVSQFQILVHLHRLYLLSTVNLTKSPRLWVIWDLDLLYHMDSGLGSPTPHGLRVYATWIQGLISYTTWT